MTPPLVRQRLRGGAWSYRNANANALIAVNNATTLVQSLYLGFRTSQKGVKLSYDESPSMRRPAK
ncbi:MAG: hypothetical protein NTV52_02680 [Acidobacteria bacterium]|nr:hypothetical protein [Acidobacteriota bacterium]